MIESLLLVVCGWPAEFWRPSSDPLVNVERAAAMLDAEAARLRADAEIPPEPEPYGEFVVRLTDRDVAFVESAVTHYRIFAEEAERQGEKLAAGTFRAQEFYGERLLIRLGGP